MSDNTAIERILALVGRIATRIRTQKAFEALATGGTLAVMVSALALVLMKTGWFGISTFWLICGLSLILPAILAVWAWSRQLDEVSLAQKIDRSHNLHDRLSTAISLANEKDRADAKWSSSQMRDAATHLEELDVVKAVPFRKPIDLTPLVVAIIAFGVVVILKPPSHDHPLPERVEIKHDPVLDSASLALEREKLEALKKQLSDLGDPEAEELVEEIEDLLDAVESRTISEKQFLEKIAQLEKKLEPKEADATKELTEALKEAAKELEKTAKDELKNDEDAKELVEALKKEDMAKASKALSKLAEKLMNKDLSEKELERLAKLFEKFSKALDLNDPAIQKMMEKHQKTLAKLQKKMDKKGGLSKKEKEQLKKAQEKIDELKKEAEKQKEKKSKRELEELVRESKEIGEGAKKVTKGGGDRDKKDVNSDEKRDEDFYKQQAGRKTKEMSKKMGKKGDQQKKDQARKMAKRQLEELKESMRRSGKQTAGKDGKESKESKERGDQMKEFLDRAKGKGKGKQGEREEGEDGSGKGDKKKTSRIEQVKKASQDAEEGHGKGAGSRELGEETKMDSKKRDEELKGEERDGASRAEIIKSTSEEGFANTDYKDMYVEYESVVEEVMEKENIPPGYRYYIKRYFQMIQPKDE